MMITVRFVHCVIRPKDQDLAEKQREPDVHLPGCDHIRGLRPSMVQQESMSRA